MSYFLILIKLIDTVYFSLFFFMEKVDQDTVKRACMAKLSAPDAILEPSVFEQLQRSVSVLWNIR